MGKSGLEWAQRERSSTRTQFLATMSLSLSALWAFRPLEFSLLKIRPYDFRPFVVRSLTLAFRYKPNVTLRLVENIFRFNQINIELVFRNWNYLQEVPLRVKLWYIFNKMCHKYWILFENHEISLKFQNIGSRILEVQSSRRLPQRKRFRSL